METGQIGFPSQSALNRFAAQDTKPSIALAQIQPRLSTGRIALVTQQRS